MTVNGPELSPLPWGVVTRTGPVVTPSGTRAMRESRVTLTTWSGTPFTVAWV